MARPATKSVGVWVVRRLRRAGYRSLFAGGCVRDMLLGRRCSDYDVATDALPHEVRRLFGRVLLIGAKFGVAMVLHEDRMVEVTTFRSDASYSDGRHPDFVKPAGPRQDALRRDFTINGMFYDPISGRLIDYVGGQADLARGVVRTIGSANRRFAEDYLRMLRAVRFAVRLGFGLCPRTASAIRRHAPRIEAISGERILDELTKMLQLASGGEALEMMHDLGLAQVVLKDLFARPGAWQSAVRRAGEVAARKDFPLTLAAVLGDLPQGTIRRIVRRWGASNHLRETLCWLARHGDDWRDAPQMPLCDFKRLMACEHFGRLRVLWRHAERARTGRQVCSRRIARRAAGIDKSRIAPAPLVTGDDLKSLGLREGPRLGRVLRAIHDAQLNEVVTTRRQALRKADEMIRR